MRVLRNLVPIMALALVLAIAGCEEEGPAEKAGKRIDEAAAKAGEEIEEAGDEIEEAAEKAEEELEEGDG